eukprot:4872645-Pyramimonas_sp.AAC.1
MLNPLGLSPFNSHTEDEINKIRAGNTESPIKLEPLSIPQIRAMIYGAMQATGGVAIVGAPPPTALERQVQKYVRQRQSTEYTFED